MCVESQSCVVIQVYILALFICRFLKDWYLSLCQRELLWTTFSNVELTVLDSDSRLRWGAGLAHPDPLIRVWISLVPRRSLLPRCPREVWERAGKRTPSQYWQNTPEFRAILPFALFPVSTTVRNLSSSIVQRFIGTNSRKKFISRLVPVAARESPLKLNKTWFRGSFFKKPKLCFSLWHARRNSSCSNDGFSATFSWSCRNLTKGPPYLIWQYWLGVLAVYLSVTSQLTVEYRIDRAENA